MTFKHVKFEDSPTMRALEKVAREKGLVKPEPLTKKASLVKKADLTPTSDLMQNVFKLCNGLREKGFVKDAADLEVKYLQYKQAQTLYETSKETGEDVVEQAHPEGSHKLENVDSVEAVIEDILDQHKKDKEVVEKDPKGDLPEGKKSTSMDVIRAVKRALGQDPLAEIKSLAAQAVQKIVDVGKIADDELWIGSASSFASDMKNKVSNPSVYNLQRAKEIIGALYQRLDPSILMGATHGGGVSDYTWNRVKPLMGQAVGLLNQAIEKRKDYDTVEQAKLEGDPEKPKEAPKADPGADLLRKIQGAAAQFAALSNQISSDDPKDADALAGTKKWLMEKSQALQQLAQQYQNEADKDSVASVYQGTLNKYLAALQKTQQEWA